MKERIADLAREIRAKQGILKDKARQARQSGSIVRKVEPASLTLSVCAVDGGLLSHRMHGTDIVAARAAGVHFVYRDSVLNSCDHFPKKNPEPSIELMSSLDEHEANVFRSLIRLKHEAACALAMIERYSPQLLLMDGSLLPHPSDRPPQGSELIELYQGVVSLFERLHAADCMLCGVIKDSRASRLTADMKLKCSDALFCSYLLDEHEMTSAFHYFEGKAPDKELAALGERVKAFYLKPSRNDIPLRVEVLGGEAEKAASLICSLSSISDLFAYPAALIEADLCAALDPREMESIEHSLNKLCGLRPLRRNFRPFR
jgi:hypothetical protein